MIMSALCNSSTNHAEATSSGILYPIASFHSFDHLSSSQKSFAMSVTQSVEPKTYKEACQHDHWLKAMNVELDALAKNGAWKLVTLPPHIKPIGNKWLYKIKHKADGSIERCEQCFHEDVYMHIPDGVTAAPNQVCKLQKSLYGLKQASRKWYEKLTCLLLQEGYQQSTADYSLFTLTQNNDFTALLVYVDDVILSGTSLTEFTRIKTILDTQFKIKDLGILKYFLGLEVAHSKAGITISQRKYSLDLLESEVN
ncbi:unnamed protein product [Trifolium pratense]|uniref:Uncharacterized protein n=1 Tax=Trifolium pratense TaxID=57577 RepID=A0ACB0KCX3_TRIPR|nr:unnamed protein product [Trifolium pratense]